MLAQTERGETQWHVRARNDSSTLAPAVFEEQGSGVRYAIGCDGNPALFSIFVLTDLDSPP